MKRRFSFLANQRGGIILGLMAVVSIVSIGWGLWSFGTSAQEKKQGIIDVTRYEDSKNNADPNKGQKNNQAIFVNLAVEGGKTGIDAVGGGADDTQIISVLDSCGTFNSPDKNKTSEQIKKAEAKKKNDIKIGETLKKNNLPTNQLTKDVVKGIQKIVETNSKLGADDQTKENVVISIIMQILQDIADNKAKVPVIDTVKQELDNQKILADEKIAKTKRDLSSALSEKEYIEKAIEVYDDLHAEGYLITDKNDLSYWKERLDYANKQIAKLDGELKALKQKENEKQGQDDTPTQDSTSESTAATEETATEATTTEEEITTEEETVETDANLHGLVPTKVAVHTHQATDHEDSYSDHYIEFWNIGELGGEQYAKATDHYVATRDGAQSSEIIFEGTFTGGPNGLIEMSAVSSSGNDKGSTAKMALQLIDGKQLENPSNGYILQIVNPEAFAKAFDGWKD